jgi:hypothetical protein
LGRELSGVIKKQGSEVFLMDKKIFLGKEDQALSTKQDELFLTHEMILLFREYDQAFSRNKIRSFRRMK